MSFAQDNGYTPVTFEQLMDLIRQGLNLQFGTDYTTESFVGTNWYKYFYPLIQKVQENEVKTSEIFQKLQEYIALTNERIQRPSVSHPGLLDSFAAHDYIASVRPPAEEDAGILSICVDVDDGAEDYADKKLEICTLIKDFVAGGIVTDGSETETITLSNGQNFPFSFHLPDKSPILLRLTCDESENNQLTVPDDETLRQKVFDQTNDRYRLGLNFEPQRYFNLADAPWAADVVLEYSLDDGENWLSAVYDANFDELLTFSLEDIQVIVNGA